MLPGYKDDENKEHSRSVNRKMFVKAHWRRKNSNRFAHWRFAEALCRTAAFPSSLLDFAAVLRAISQFEMNGLPPVGINLLLLNLARFRRCAKGCSVFVASRREQNLARGAESEAQQEGQLLLREFAAGQVGRCKRIAKRSGATHTNVKNVGKRSARAIRRPRRFASSREDRSS